jgi:hypothetical protein
MLVYSNKGKISVMLGNPKDKCEQLENNQVFTKSSVTQCTLEGIKRGGERIFFRKIIKVTIDIFVIFAVSMSIVIKMCVTKSLNLRSFRRKQKFS